MTPGAVSAQPGPVLRRPCPPRPVRQDRSWTMPPVPPAPEWLHNPPEPYALARTGYARARDGIDRNEAGALVCGLLGTYLLWGALTWRPWIPAAVTAAVWVGALAYGWGVLTLCHADAAPGRWTVRACHTTLAAITVLGVVGLLTGHLLVTVLGSLAAAQAFARRPALADDAAWWGAPLRQALITRKAVPRDDVWLSYRGARPAPGGVQQVKTVIVAGPNRLPLGLTADMLRPRLRELEAALPGLKVGQLHVTHDNAADDDANVITWTVTPPPRRDVVPAVLPDRWDYNEALPIGKDRLGNSVTRRTWGCHAGYVGMTGSGKTWFGRYEVAHALLDPTVRVYLIDGKGDDHDWTAMHPLCQRVVVGCSVAAGRQALALLDELNALSESRRSQPEAEGVVVVVDEFYRLLLEVRRRDPKLAADLDGALIGLHATARSRRIRILTFWQAGTKDYITKAMRVNIGQRFCGQVESTSEVRYFLEHLPQHLPAASGQFIVKDEGHQPVLVTVPALDSAGFADVCTRAARLRAGDADVCDPLEAKVRDLLALEPLRAKTLLDLLPDDLKPRNSKGVPSAQVLGFRVRGMRGVVKVQLGKDPGYQLANHSPHVPAQLTAAGSPAAAVSVTGTDAPAGERVP